MNLVLSGEARWRVDKANSGDTSRRDFRAACGTPLFSKADPRPNPIFMRTGGLDDPERIAPRVAIRTGAAPTGRTSLPQLGRQALPVA